MIWIHSTGWLDIPCCFYIDLDPLYWLIRYPLLLFYWFQCIRVHHLICGPSFRAHKRLKIVIFGQNRRLKVHNMNFKWFGSTLLVNSISLVAFLLISVHLGTSLDLWTFISGPQKAKNRYIWSKSTAQGP